jgi:hypothetical protein
MPIYEFSREEIHPLSKTTFSQVQLQERRDIQRLLRANVSVIAPDTMVIAEVDLSRFRAAPSAHLNHCPL